MKALRYLISLPILLCCIVVNAHDFVVDGIYYNITDVETKTVEVTFKGSDSMLSNVYGGSLTIPSTVNYENETYSVTGIGYYAFRIDDLESLIIPKSVVSINEYMFNKTVYTTYIQHLTKILVEEGNPVYDSRGNCNAIIETATNTLLYGCNTTVIPEGITIIGKNAFSGCTKLTELHIPQSVTKVEYSAFERCSELGAVYIDDLFAWCNIDFSCSPFTASEGKLYLDNELVTNLIIPNGISKLSEATFKNCVSLVSVTIPQSVTQIYYNPFAGCSSLQSIIVEEGNSRYDSRNNCNAIIESYYSSCELITGCMNTVIPEGVTSIGSNAFWGCKGLTNITIPEDVTLIGQGAFENCTNLVEVTALPTIAPALDYVVFNGIGEAILNYPENSNYTSWGEYFSNFEISKNIYNSKDEVWVVDAKGNARVICKTPYAEENTLYGYSGDKVIKTVRIDEGFTHIDQGACQSIDLEEVILPSTIKVIGNRAFFGCENLKSIYLPEGLEEIEDEAFSNTAITCVVIPTTVTSIGDQAFTSGNVVLKTFNSPVIEGDLYIDAYVPESALYPHDKFSTINYFNPRKEYIWLDGDWTREELFVFGNLEGSNKSEFSTAKSVVFTPDVDFSSFRIITTLPKVERVDVIASTDIYNHSYTIKNSNAIFSDNTLEVGCIATVIPENIKSIGSQAFLGCVGLQKLEMPNSVRYIGSRCFESCTNLTELVLGRNVESIGEDAFLNCTSLASIVVDDENLTYDSRDNCNAIIETAKNKFILASTKSIIPSSVTSIARGAFTACADYNLIVPTTVTSIDNGAFSGLNRLYFESDTPAAIGGDVFGRGAIYVPVSAYETYCNADVWKDYKDRIVTTELAEKDIEVWSTEGMSGILNEVGLNEADKVVKLKVKGEINSYDMIVIRDKMPLLNELDLSEAAVVASSKPFYQTYCTGKNSLGGYAFYDLDKLVSVKLPKELKTLGDYAFKGCDKLEYVDASATSELNIGSYAFERCVKLTEFVSPEKISEVGNYAFTNCSKLGEIELRDIAGSIGENAFGYCGKLKTIDIYSIGGDIKTKAFYNCSSLEDVRVDAIGGNLCDEAFGYCQSLKSVEFENGPVKMGSRLFVLSDNLESFVAGEGTTEVADQAFYAIELIRNSWGGESESNISRPNLKKVSLPQGVQKIGEDAFYRCSGLKDFTMPQSVTSIGESAFYNCSSIESITIPNGITSIADNAFQYCSSLKSITFPDELITIGPYAFYGCAFEILKLPPTLKTINDNAFYGCSSLKELHIPSSVERIRSYAFSSCSKLNAVYTYTVEPTMIEETTFSTFASATLYVPATSFWNYYWDKGWSKFNHKNFKDFNEKYEYFYLNNDYYLNGETGYIEGTPDADLRPGSGLIVEADKNNEDGKQDLGDVNVGTDENGKSASIIGDENLSIENLHVKINVKGGRWYFFAFPWNVPLHRVSMQNGSDYVFRYYDGEERAKHGHGGWKDVHEPHLKAARGYIFQSSANDVLLISIENVKFKNADKFNELVAHASENLNDASWNLMGNPYLSYYDMGGLDYSAPVTVWDGEKYSAIRPGDDDYQFAPYEAFFVQKPEGKDNVGFDAEGQMTKTQATTLAAQQAAARRARSIDPHRQLINLVLSYEETNDRTRVVFNDRQSHNYEVACDAAKFQSEGVVQVYTLDGEGVRYAINERPVGNGVVQIGYTATENGYYTIEAARMDAKVYLYDAETKIKHNLDEGSYTFFSGKGTFEKRFTLGKQDGETTHIKDVDIDAVVEVVEGGIQFKGIGMATIFNASGMQVAVMNGAGVVKVPAGTYAVRVGEQNKKVVVK